MRLTEPIRVESAAARFTVVARAWIGPLKCEVVLKRRGPEAWRIMATRSGIVAEVDARIPRNGLDERRYAEKVAAVARALALAILVCDPRLLPAH